MRVGRPIVLGLFAVALASAARGQPRAASEAEGVQPMLDVSGARPMLVLRNTSASALRGAGISRTAVDRRFAGEAVEGSFGFLCGLKAGQTDRGSAAVRGYDPQGRFLGAKLRFSF